MTALDFLGVYRLWSRERNGFASKSEMRRWLNDGAVLFNGEKTKHDEPIDFPLISVVAFPKSSRNRTTLW